MDTRLPAEIANLLGTSHLRGHSLLLTARTDLDDLGHSAEQWLLVTEFECAIATGGDAATGMPPRCLRTFQFEHIGGCRVRNEVGSGYLQVLRNNVWVDLLRFSNCLASQFREIARKLEHLRRHREFHIEPDAEGNDGARTASELQASTKGGPRSVPVLPTLRRVLGLLWPYRFKASLICMLSVLTVAIELAPPWLQKILVDNILAGKTEGLQWGPVMLTLATIVGCLFGIRVLAAGIAISKATLSSQIGTRLTADLRMQMVDKLQRLSVAYHDRHQVGMLMSRVSYDTEAMHTFMHQVSGGFVLQILQLIAIGVMLFVLNPQLAMWTLLPMPLVMAASWFFCKYLYVRHHRYWDAVGHQAVALSSLLSGIRVVKSFTQEPREQAKFQETSERLRDSRVGLDLATATFSSLVGFLFGLGGLIVWYVGGRNVLSQDMTLGSLMAFLAYLSMFYAPLTTISEGATWVSSFFAASNRIFELLDTPITVTEPDQPAAVENIQGHLKFENVSFSYDDQKPALKDVSFELRPGESLGIVGRSGSGKSTLVCLISRLYDVENGCITIDGIDVKRISSPQLRRHVGMVLQAPFLFEGTIASNIAYGDPAAQADRIIASAKAAAAHDFILRMPFGYESILGEGGAGLSGGERQRMSIARAILYDPRILILDEATSSIDTESERLIQRAIERFSKGRTLLAIAHRLSTLEQVDRLLVMDQGRLVEQGTHRELLAAGGLYARLVKLQFGAGSTSGGAAIALAEAQTAADASGGVTAVDDSELLDDVQLDWEVCWLSPQQARFATGIHEVLSLHHNGQEYSGVYLVRAFPASHSDAYLSVRYEDERGHDQEVGMIRSLSDWPQESQELIRRSLNRRYLLRNVRGLVSIQDDNGFVNCVAETDDGQVEFVVHANPHNVKRFGYNGRLLTDLDQNHYLIHDLDQFPYLQRRLFKQLFPELT